jgi:hypothetical protein
LDHSNSSSFAVGIVVTLIAKCLHPLQLQRDLQTDR